METRQALLTRRSVRSYQPDHPIAQEDLVEVLEAACHAPSGLNLQPWYFLALTGQEELERLREIMAKVSEKMHPNLARRFERHPETIRETENFLTTLGGAPACVLVFFLRDQGAKDRDGAMQSVAAGIENLLLSAWDKGIASCWISAPQKMGFGEEIRAQFAPDKGEFVAMVTLGYAQRTPRMPPRREGRWTIR